MQFKWSPPVFLLRFWVENIPKYLGMHELCTRPPDWWCLMILKKDYNIATQNFFPQNSENLRPFALCSTKKKQICRENSKKTSNFPITRRITQHPQMGGVWTLRGFFMAAFPIWHCLEGPSLLTFLTVPKLPLSFDSKVAGATDGRLHCWDCSMGPWVATSFFLKCKPPKKQTSPFKIESLGGSHFWQKNRTIGSFWPFF